MSLLPVGFGGSVAAYDIAKSVRFRSSANPSLARTFGGSGSRRKWTFSTWFKVGALSATQILFSRDVGGGTFSSVAIMNTGAFRLYDVASSVERIVKTSTALLRDPSAHYHLFVCVDTDNATVSDRAQIWLNGARITSFSASTDPTLNYDTVINASGAHQVGNFASTAAADGYLSEINFIDGQALDATSFGQFDANGVWQPKKYTGTYGTNGFYLAFSNGTNLTTLCADASGNGNNFTASGISLTTGATYDWMDDTPTNNFATLNPLHAGRSTLSNVNLTASGSTDLPTIVPSSGTYYFEISGVSKTWTPPAAFPAGAGDYNFGQRPFTNTATAPKLCTKNLPAGSITTSGTFTGNASTDGPFVWLNGNPSTMTINGNAVTFGTHADKTAGGFKVRSSSASYNTAGSNTYSVTVTGKLFGDSARTPNTAQGNP